MIKRLIATMILGLLIICPPPVLAEKSGEKTADAAIVSGGGALAGIVVLAPTSGVTLFVYDNASAASGTSLVPTWVIPASSQALHSIGFGVNPVICPYYNGIYVDIDSTGTVKYEVYYIPTR